MQAMNTDSLSTSCKCSRVCVEKVTAGIIVLQTVFSAVMKHEQLNYDQFRSKGAATLSIIDFLAFCNGKRIHSTLGYQSLLQFKQEFYRNKSYRKCPVFVDHFIPQVRVRKHFCDIKHEQNILTLSNFIIMLPYNDLFNLLRREVKISQLKKNNP